MGAKYSIDDNFDNLNIDNYKAYIHKKMQDGGGRTNHHFLLTNSNHEHGTPALRDSVVHLLGLT
jgi:hypothetical protein